MASTSFSVINPKMENLFVTLARDILIFFLRVTIFCDFGFFFVLHLAFLGRDKLLSFLTFNLKTALDFTSLDLTLLVSAFFSLASAFFTSSSSTMQIPSSSSSSSKKANLFFSFVSLVEIVTIFFFPPLDGNVQSYALVS